MTGILSREQEFIKINQQLDNMTKCAVEKPQPTKFESKFSTFTKKGPITIIRKIEDISLGLREKNAQTLPKDKPTLNGARKKPLPKDHPAPEIADEKTLYSERSGATSPQNSVRTLPSTKKILTKNPPNVIVQYKNSSFVQSPSLEAIARDETDSLRSRATSRMSEASEAALSTVRPKANLSSEGLIKYLKSRIVILQEEHDTLTTEMKNQKDLVEKSVERQKKIENQRDLAYSRNNTISEQMKKLEGQLEDALQRLKDSDADHNATRKELETVKRELKVLTQNNANLEKRLYRTNEELENTKNTLSQVKTAEKETKESIRNETDNRDKQIKTLRKQRADLLNAHKKQLYLIDNLKRQNLCLEQSRLIAFGEKEFTKVLDWQVKN